MSFHDESSYLSKGVYYNPKKSFTCEHLKTIPMMQYIFAFMVNTLKSTYLGISD
jgi:hypothetical protein